MAKAEFSTHIISKETWRKFIESHQEYKEMKYQEFVKYWEDIAETIRKEIITNPLGVKLGSYTGELKLQYLPHKYEAFPKDKRPDDPERVKFANIVTRGKVANVKWERRWAVRFNKMLQFFAYEANYKLYKMAKEYIDSNPEKLRVSRNTLGGYSIWRTLTNTYGTKKDL